MHQEGIIGRLFGRNARWRIEGELTAASLRDWLVKRLAAHLRVEPSGIDTTRRFDDYGLDSLVAIQVSGDLEKVVERRLSAALLFEHATIDELVQHLASECGLRAA